MNQLDRFLDMVFSHVPPGHIEVRLLPESKHRSSKGVSRAGRRWFNSAAALAAAVPELLQQSVAERLAVCFGVLPRASLGKGKSSDVLRGRAAWSDLDFKDYAGGESEARERLARFASRPSAVVRSGHGLHAYWILQEPAEPDPLCRACKAIAMSVGGDNVADAARVMRLPTSRNWKDGGNGQLTEFEEVAPERTYALADLEQAVVASGFEPGPAAELSAQGRGVAVSPAGRRPSCVGAGDHASVALQTALAVINGNKYLRDLFFGHGKPRTSRKGAQLDTSRSGYDFSLLHALVDAGVADRNALAAVLRSRPGGGAAAKGEGYISRTVEAALAAHDQPEADGTTQVDFGVDAVRIYTSVPPIIELTIGGRTLTLGHADLRKRARFEMQFLAQLHRLPVLPRRGEAWDGFVRELLARAEARELPPEASPRCEIRDAVLEAVGELQEGEDEEDLKHGKSVRVGAGLLFRTDAILRRLRDRVLDCTSQDVCKVLSDEGFRSDTTHVKGKGVRGWIAPSATLQRLKGESQEDPHA